MASRRRARAARSEATKAASAPAKPSAELPLRERHVAIGLVALVTLFNLVFLLPETTSSVLFNNDSVFHEINLRETVRAIKDLRDPTDFWLPQIAGGYPIFHHYQHLPYIPLAIFGAITGVSASEMLRWSTYLLLSGFPAVSYLSMRRFGYPLLTAAGAGVAVLFATGGNFGFDYSSYTWRGYGLYTQLWGMTLLPLALAFGYRALQSGRGLAIAAGLLGALTLCHLVFGYIAVGSLIVIAVACASSRTDAKDRGVRLAVIFAGFLAVCAYMFVPALLDSTYLNRSVWEDQQKYDSFGARVVLENLIEGRLFDQGRVPALTILVGIGLVASALRWREPLYRLPGVLFVFWTLLYFGRPFWGSALDLLPLGKDLQLHRLIGGVHLAGMMLIGLALTAMYDWIRRHLDAQFALPATVALIVICLVPVMRERQAYLDEQGVFIRTSSQSYAAERGELDEMKTYLDSLPYGRTYAGLAGNWGAQYRIGSTAFYGWLTTNDFDSIGRLYHALAMFGDIQVTFDDRTRPQYETLGIRYVIQPANRPALPFATHLRTFGRHAVYEIPGASLFDAGTTPLVFEGGKSQFYEAASAWFKSSLPAQHIYPAIDLGDGQPPEVSRQGLLAAPLAIAGLAGTSQGVRGAVLEEKVSPGRYEARVRMDSEGTLVLKAGFHPGLKARVDGESTGAFMVTPGYTAVSLTAGTHDVVFEYEPPWYRLPLLIAGLVALGSLAVAERRIARRATQAAASERS